MTLDSAGGGRRRSWRQLGAMMVRSDGVKMQFTRYRDKSSCSRLPEGSSSGETQLWPWNLSELGLKAGTVEVWVWWPTPPNHIAYRVSVFCIVQWGEEQ